MRITDKYVFFWGNESVFSQWYPSTFVIDGVTYSTAEQFMMASKARLFNDGTICSKILATNDPKKQKSLGRSVSGFDKATWEKHAKDVVYEGNKAKFLQNRLILQDLANTGSRTIVEASPYDKIWGIGLHWSDSRCDDSANWQGTNWLGEVLTKLRDDFMNDPQQRQQIHVESLFEEGLHDIVKGPDALVYCVKDGLCGGQFGKDGARECRTLGSYKCEFRAWMKDHNHV
jgi:ribA/ribD-fused uncharacterized protein